MKVLARLFGTPDDAIPESYADFVAWFRTMMDSEVICVTPEAREVADTILKPPLPFVARPAWQAVNFLTAGFLPGKLRRGYGFTWTAAHRALNDSERDDWAWASEAAARDVAEGRADQGVVACWTGTGASIAANKVPGIRAALCGDAQTAAGARKWNDANALALSLRSTSQAELEEILDAWFASEASGETDDRANVDHLSEIEPEG